MTQACRDKLIQATRSESDNAGLLLASYLKEQDEGSKKEITNNACDACKRVDPVYGMAFRRWKEQLPPNTRTAVVSTLGRFVTGLGTASALETGIRLHHTYGTPIIPGSGLKGLASHYCHRIWGERDTEFSTTVIEDNKTRPGASFQVLFGDLEKSGLIIFHDAWMLPEDLQGNIPNCGLIPDVMTPHHSQYGIGGQVAPSDFDSPIPVPFLSIAGRFLVAVSPNADGPKAGEWVQLAIKLLRDALHNWGAGGKTRSGYGRFSSSETQ
jgi:CRISPR-associated protein Cmr6